MKFKVPWPHLPESGSLGHVFYRTPPVAASGSRFLNVPNLQQIVENQIY